MYRHNPIISMCYLVMTHMYSIADQTGYPQFYVTWRREFLIGMVTERSIADPSETVFQWEMNCAT